MGPCNLGFNCIRPSYLQFYFLTFSLQSENKTQRIAEKKNQFISFKLHIVLSGRQKSCSVLLHPTWEENHPFLRDFILWNSPLPAQQPSPLPDAPSQCLSLSYPYSLEMAPKHKGCVVRNVIIYCYTCSILLVLNFTVGVYEQKKKSQRKVLKICGNGMKTKFFCAVKLSETHACCIMVCVSNELSEHLVFLGFDTICSFRHPLWVLEPILG